MALSATPSPTVAATSTGTSVLTATATAPINGCPSGWRCGDIGGPPGAGRQSAGGALWTVRGAGRDVWGASDQFRYLWQPLKGDGGIGAQVVSQGAATGWAKAGPMLRRDTSAGAAHYAAFVTPAHGVLIQYRPSAGADAIHVTLAPATPPVYLRILRVGTLCSTYSSTDRRTWLLVPGSRIALDLGSTVLTGLAVTSHKGGSLSSVVFDTIRLL